MIKYLITIVLTIALCCSCNREDFSADPTIMPPATQTGANTFGCLIDGWYIRDSAMTQMIRLLIILPATKTRKR